MLNTQVGSLVDKARVSPLSQNLTDIHDTEYAQQRSRITTHENPPLSPWGNALVTLGFPLSAQHLCSSLYFLHGILHLLDICLCLLESTYTETGIPT